MKELPEDTHCFSSFLHDSNKLMVKNKKAIPLSRIPSPNISEFTYEYMYPFYSINNKQLPQFIIDKLWIARDKRSKNRRVKSIPFERDSFTCTIY